MNEDIQIRVPMLEKVISELKTETIEQSFIIEAIKARLNTILFKEPYSKIDDYDDNGIICINNQLDYLISKVKDNTRYLHECLDHLSDIV